MEGAEEETVDSKTFQDMDSAGQAAFLEATQTSEVPLGAEGVGEEQLLQAGAQMSVAKDALA